MTRNSLFGTMFWLYRQRILLLVPVLLLCACSAEGQPVVSANQPIPSTSKAPASNPMPVSTSTKILSTPRPPSRMVTPDASVWGSELVEVLRGGGYVIYIHTEESDTDIQNLENCSQQSSLSDRGQTDAMTIGASFLALGVPVGQVLHSGSCSSLDTATLAFGQGKYWADLSKVPTPLRGERISALRQLLSARPVPGTNNVFIGHGMDISDVTGLAFAQGEAAIYKPLGNPGYSFVARVLPEAWSELKQNSADLAKSEPYVLESIPLEKTGPTPEPNDLLQSGAGGQGQVLPPGQPLTAERDLLLPDLRTLPPTDLRIRVNSSDGHKLLRLTNSIMNIGPGKLEIWGTVNLATGKMTVTQHIYDTDDSTEKRVVGEFFFHPEHNHWHFGEFARYDILALGPDGEFNTVVASSDKVSYCLRDDARSDISEAAVYQSYISCEQKRQGISVGWIDIYRYYLPGQSIDITFLLDGVYALRSTVDPENNLRDKDRANNTAVLYIEIEGNKVKIVEAPFILNELLDRKH